MLKATYLSAIWFELDRARLDIASFVHGFGPDTMIIRHVFQLTTIAKNRSHATLNISRLERMLREDIHRANAANYWKEMRGSQKDFSLTIPMGTKSNIEFIERVSHVLQGAITVSQALRN